MITAKITSLAQVPAAIAAVMGFKPVDSLVVLAIGGGPTARVDVAGDLADPLAALAAAAPHWRTTPPMVILFGTDHDLGDLVAAWEAMNVDVIDFLHVRTFDDVTIVTSHAQGKSVSADASDLDPALAAARTTVSRDDLVAVAAKVATAEEAWTVARASYLAGDGARAWVHLDRYVALNGEDQRSISLGRFLADAVDPKSALAQTLLPD